ncbi:DUF4489 domain-containing protein [Wukongibacter baidiensis]|uniref:DUF4489 domain-containing protein n=1 Tax=Wukongibacter baidiensis TaxID=1723361 RepID=UPI003D7F6523
MSSYMKIRDDFDKKCNKKTSCDSKKDIDCGKVEKPGKPMLLFCGNGVDAEFTSANSPAVNVGFVTVDTTCLCKPLVKIKFSSIVNLTGLAALPNAILNFRLFRVCENSESLLLNTWVYQASLISDNAVPLTFNTSFTFNFCDRLSCPRCCDYYVEASVSTLANATVGVSAVQVQAITQ